MKPSYTGSQPVRRGGVRKILGGAAALALFLPLPALALTFLGSWQITQQQTGSAPRATVTSHDTGTGGVLNIDLKSFSARATGTSTVTAVRNFQVASPSEVVTVARNLQSILKNASVDATVQIQGIGFPAFSDAAGSRPRLFQDTTSRTKRLRGGTYRVVVTVRNTKDRNGSWNTVSPYQFTFSGVRGPAPNDIENSFLQHYRAPDNPFVVQPAAFD